MLPSKDAPILPQIVSHHSSAENLSRAGYRPSNMQTLLAWPAGPVLAAFCFLFNFILNPSLFHVLYTLNKSSPRTFALAVPSA